MPQITTFLTFADRAEEAAAFYVSIFPNSRITEVLRYGEVVPGMAGKVMTVRFELEGQEYVALNGGPNFSFSQGFSLAVMCETQAEVDRYWEALLADGGSPLACGWLTDRFGVSWQVTPTILPALIAQDDPAAVRRTMEAMMGMVKLDADALRRASEGVAQPTA